MPILSGPIRIEQIANLIENVSQTFYARKGYIKNVRTRTDFWEPDLIVYPSELISYSKDLSDVNILYEEAYRSNCLQMIASKSKDFAVTISMSNGDRTKVSTEIINKTLLQDILRGQTFPPVNQQFIITSFDWDANAWHYSSNTNPNIVGNGRGGWRFFNEFIAFRDQVIGEAQKRIKSGVSKASFHLLDDLHL